MSAVLVRTIEHETDDEPGLVLTGAPSAVFDLLAALPGALDHGEPVEVSRWPDRVEVDVWRARVGATVLDLLRGVDEAAERAGVETEVVS